MPYRPNWQNRQEGGGLPYRPKWLNWQEEGYFLSRTALDRLMTSDHLISSYFSLTKSWLAPSLEFFRASNLTFLTVGMKEASLV